MQGATGGARLVAALAWRARRLRQAARGLRYWASGLGALLLVAAGACYVGGVGPDPSARRGARTTAAPPTATVAPAGAEACPTTPRAAAPAAALPRTALPAADLARHYGEATERAGEWRDLTTVDWESAVSGWQAAADFNRPRKGLAFPGTPLTVGGQPFASGIGTYPLSELTYPLDGQFAALRGQAAVDDSAPARGSVRFSVYADDRLVYRSPIVVHGDPPADLAAPLFGARTLRLVVDDAGDSPRGDYADWLSLAVFRPAAWDGLARADQVAAAPAPAASTQPASAERDQALQQLAVARRAAVAEAGAPAVAFDRQACAVVLATAGTVVAFGYGGPHHGRVAVLPAGREQPVALDGPATIVLAGGGWLSLTDTRPAPDRPWETASVTEPGLGAGQQLTVHLRTLDGDPVAVELAVFESGSVTYRLRPGGNLVAQGYQYFDATSRAVVGAAPRFLSDRSRLWRGRLADDGLRRTVPLEPGKPFLLWSDATKNGLLLTTLDPSEAPLEVTLAQAPDDAGVTLGLALEYLPQEVPRAGAQASPRLLLQAVDATHVLGAFAGYRALMQQLYPAAPLPAWVKYQWNSWWAYGPTVTEAAVREQVDYIARHLADLGPWSVGIDAGWHVAYGRPTADLRNVDYEKFPNGLRPVVDYAHERGVKVILYTSTGFIHNGTQPAEWLALRAFILDHPEWLIPLSSTDGLTTYMFNYAHPGVRRYMEEVVDDFIHQHGVDGINLDGLADPEGQLTSLRARDLFRGAAPYLPSLDIYRLIGKRLLAARPDGYVDSGWVTPVFAHPYAHTFRYADEWPRFDYEYPFSGLIQKIDYALFQRLALGQRSHMAMVWGEANDRDVRSWFEAGLALGAQVTVGFNLAAMRDDSLSALRTLLAHHNAFEGETVASARARSSAFATTTGHLTYLGVLNRSSQPRALDAEIAELGVLAPGLWAYDVEAGRWLPATDVPFVTLAPKSFRLFVVPHQPRVVWSNAAWSYEPSDDGGLVVTLRGPADLPGFAQLWAPGTHTVLLDGAPLRQAAEPGPGAWALDAQTGVVRVALTYGEPHRLELRW
jgi:hypothetical protein